MQLKTFAETMSQSVAKFATFAEYLTNELDISLASGMSLREFKVSYFIKFPRRTMI